MEIALVLSEIMGFLPPHERAKCALVQRSWNNQIKDDALLDEKLVFHLYKWHSYLKWVSSRQFVRLHNLVFVCKFDANQENELVNILDTFVSHGLDVSHVTTVCIHDCNGRDHIDIRRLNKIFPRLQFLKVIRAKSIACLSHLQDSSCTIKKLLVAKCLYKHTHDTTLPCVRVHAFDSSDSVEVRTDSVVVQNEIMMERLSNDMVWISS